jgi:hypothetical protein
MDTRDIRQDRRDLGTNRQNLQNAEKSGNQAAINADKRDIRSDRRDLRNDVKDRQGDTRDLSDAAKKALADSKHGSNPVPVAGGVDDLLTQLEPRRRFPGDAAPTQPRIDRHIRAGRFATILA